VIFLALPWGRALNPGALVKLPYNNSSIAVSQQDAPLKVVLLLPIYNDWPSVSLLLTRIDAGLAREAEGLKVVLVDDGSSLAMPEDLLERGFRNIASVEHLRLRRNLGSQRAIAIGLGHIYQEHPCDAVLVMDADGEDKPEDTLALLRRFHETGGEQVIFAERARRSEDWKFRVGYQAYRFMHRLLTGMSVKFGNFSLVPYRHLSGLVAVSETWNHYAASILKARIPFTAVPTDRGTRYAGHSNLNLVGLVVHGLSAISVFSEVVGVRLILAILLPVLGVVGLMLVVIGIRLFSTLAIPGWATNAVGFLLVIVLQMLTVTVSLTFSVLFSRNSLSFLPLRDYRYFVDRFRTLYERPK
jgi:polyisoprenyl-phosphate glycosyltransferase